MSAKELVIVYRIYPKVSKVTPVYPTDKLKLSELCLKSFQQALKGVDFKMIVLLDNCPPEYMDMFKKYFSYDQMELMPQAGIGNHGTFNLQMDLLSTQQDAEFVYFAEDDYFYLPGAFRTILDFMKANPDADFVTPYDHLDYYQLPLHRHPVQMRLSGQQHWRTAATTCLTFMTRRSVLIRTWNTFRSYSKGNLDVCLWLALTKTDMFNFPKIIGLFFKERWLFSFMKNTYFRNTAQLLFGKKYQLWVPVLSLSTHMDTVFLAPGIDWMEKFNQH